MFSGIVAGQGVLKAIRASAQSVRIEVQHRGLIRCVRIGDSVAINGCCLTIVAHQAGVLVFDVLDETWNRTCLQHAHSGEHVNLEGALRVGNPLGGHWITGHIDGVGRITHSQKQGRDVLFEIKPPAGFMQWIVHKGSVAIDGVSLTVAEVKKRRFKVWLIPHTMKLTTLGWKREGDPVNLEGDMFAKYVQKFISKL